MSGPPLLLGEPIPLPSQFQGAFAGAAVCFDLGALVEWPWEGAAILAPLTAAQRALDARRPALPPDTDESAAAEATRRAFNSEQRALTRRWYAARCAAVVWGFTGGDALPTGPIPPEDWARFPGAVTQWIATVGYKAAEAQALAPFLPSADASSSSIDG